VAIRQRVRILAPVSDPAPVVVNTPPVVDATLVAVVTQAPVVVQHVAVVEQDQVETPMETDEDELLAKLFFKKYGRALPAEKEKEKDVDINFVIDLTDDTEEMEDDTTPLLIPNPVVKSEPIEAAEAPEIVAKVNVNVANVNSVYNESGICVSRRLELIQLAKARKAITAFGQSLRKKDFIPEKEAPLAAGASENVIADTDTNMSEDTLVNLVESATVNSVETVEQTIAESEATIAESEAAITKTDAAIADNQREFVAKFGDTPVDEFDVDIEPLC
jgi:hypothetical protein